MTRMLPALILLFDMQTPIQYPGTRKDAIVEDHFGTKIADPYRWLEDDNSAETKAWLTVSRYLCGIAGRTTRRIPTARGGCRGPRCDDRCGPGRSNGRRA